MCEYNKYDVIFGEFPDNNGSIQSGCRPGIVIQNSIGNRYSPTLIAIPLTSKIKKPNQATHLLIKGNKENGLLKDSMLLAEQITTIDKAKAKELCINNLFKLCRIFLRECCSKIRRIAGYVTDF